MYFEDIRLGERREIGTHTFTADEIKRFAAQFDPQPFHMDEEAAKHTHFGALCASGWHTAAWCMRFLVEDHKRRTAELRARGEPIAKWGPSPGFRDLQWRKPVYVGDTITYSAEPTDKRESKSRPEWGLLFSRNTGVNQNGDLVYSFIGSAFIERRPTA